MSTKLVLGQTTEAVVAMVIEEVAATGEEDREDTRITFIYLSSRDTKHIYDSEELLVSVSGRPLLTPIIKEG